MAGDVGALVDGDPTTSVALSRSGPRYRRDIQGLRGVAVLLVVTYHARTGVTGGFLGVDMFLVVSGFVIGGVLFGEHARTGAVRLGRFYARRVRRLLPALAIFLIATGALTVVFLSPFGDQQRMLWTAMAATVFLANVELYRTTGYFDGSAERNPFLHTWSLSLEEQFYLVLPIVLVVCWWVVARSRHRTRSMVDPDNSDVEQPDSTVTRAAWTSVGVWAVAVLAIVSIVLALVLSYGPVDLVFQAPRRLVFYSMPTRMWQFCSGVVVAFGWDRIRAVSHRSRVIMGLTGTVAVAAAVVMVDPLAPSMNVWTVAVTIGTVGLILAGPSGTAVTGLLESAPLVWLGDRSYGWYLWHWPFIVMAGIRWPGHRGALVLAAVVSLVPTILSYRYVERPFRTGSRWLGRPAVGLAGVCILVPLVVLGGLRSGADRHWGLVEPAGWNDQPETHGTICHIINRDAINDFDVDTCTFGPSPDRADRTVLLVGDSLAQAVGPAVVDAAGELGHSTVHWSREGCAYAPPAAGSHHERCEEWQLRVTRLIDTIDPSVVVIANQELDSSQRAGFAPTVHGLLDRSIPVVIVAPLADFGDSFPLHRLSIIDPHPRIPVLSRETVDAERGPVLAVLRTLGDDQPSMDRQLVIVDPLDELCNDECSPVRDGEWINLDRSHLTTQGAWLLTRDFRRALERVTDST